MESFIIIHDGTDYTITPALHDGFFNVAGDTISAMLTKDANGEWVFHLQSSNIVELPASEIGDKIDCYLKDHGRNL
jgi:hypothetical protein